MTNKLHLLCLLILSCSILSAQTWEQVSSLPEDFRTHHSFGFSLDGMGYLVTGGSNDGPRDDFYQYDPSADTWTQLTDFPGPARGYAIGDVYEGKAYLGFGSSADAYLGDLWVYDNTTDEWTQLADCTCDGRNHPAFVAHQGKIFMGMGNNGGGNQNDWWMYDIQTDTWEERAGFPGLPVHHPYMFAIGDYVYAGFGHGNGFISDEWYRYDPVADEWTQVASIPDEGRVAGTQFSHNGKGYALSGDNEDHSSFETGQFWEYDGEMDTWTELTPHPSTSRWSPASFVIDNEVYLINGMTLVVDEWLYVDEVYKYAFEETPQTLTVQLKTFLEGTYDPASGEMTTYLQDDNLIPIEQPFNTAPWDYAGTEAVGSTADIWEDVVDWALVEMRSFDNPDSIVAQKAGFLLKDGRIVEANNTVDGLSFDLFTNETYYAVVRVRGHLSIMTESPLTVPSAAYYDFSTDQWQAKSDGVTPQLADMSDSGVFGMKAGDIDGEGTITVTDLNLYIAASSAVLQYNDSDINKDKNVTVADFNWYLPNTSAIAIEEVRY